MQSKEITRRWRKLGFEGRLYWKRKNWRWRNFWDSEDVAAWRFKGGGSMHFHGIMSLVDFIIEEELKDV